jgi:hypothetical protein
VVLSVDQLTPEQQDSLALVNELTEYDSIDAQTAARIKSLWQSNVFQTIWDRRSEFQVVDSHKVRAVVLREHSTRNAHFVTADSVCVVAGVPGRH